MQWRVAVEQCLHFDVISTCFLRRNTALGSTYPCDVLLFQVNARNSASCPGAESLCVANQVGVDDNAVVFVVVEGMPSVAGAATRVARCMGNGESHAERCHFNCRVLSWSSWPPYLLFACSIIAVWERYACQWKASKM